MATKNIMVIEDDQGIREILKLALTFNGYETTCAENGKEALELLKTSTKPELILLDQIMPVMDGHNFIRELRSKEKFQNTPVVVMSASKPLDFEGYVQGFINKPIELSELFKVAEHYCH